MYSLYYDVVIKVRHLIMLPSNYYYYYYYYYSMYPIAQLQAAYFII